MNSDRPIYKACKHCQKDFLQNEIFNHQRSCNAKQKEIHKSISSQPQINVEQQICQEPIHKSISQQNNQSLPQGNVDVKLSQFIFEKYKGKVQILDIKPLPKEESIIYQEQQSKQILYQQPIQQQPYNEMQFQQQFSFKEVNNQKPIYEQSFSQQPQKQEINQLDQQNLIKCEHCNCLLNAQDKEFHEMNCSSCIRFNDIINEEAQQYINQKQVLPQNNNQIEIANNQKIITQYLKIYWENKDIILKGKKLLDGALFKSLKFKKTFDQRTCYFCRDYFKEDEIIYNVECCLLKCHKKCLHNMIKNSTKCYNCNKELFPTKGKAKK